MNTDAPSDPLLDRFGVCTDEVHPDLETALQATRAMGIHRIELLAFWDKPVVELDDEEIDRARGLIEHYEMQVSAIGSLFLKLVELGGVSRGAVEKDAAFRKDLEMLRASIRVAKRLGAPIVRTYAFRRDEMIGLGNPSPRLPRGGEIPDEMLEKVVEGLRIAAREAADAGVILGLENVRSCWANTGHNAGRIIAATDHPALKAIWDPGNDYVSGGRPYPEGYEAVRGQIGLIHVKDARVVDHANGLTAWEAVGNGEIDYVAQFRALRRDGYTGCLSLETHWHPRRPDGGEPDRIADSKTSFEGIRAALRSSLAN
ncbi:MAG TPA: sugar phosphate isomerase/epimerase family protein [Chloroflexota bacterium]|nr:sugar phosphate isomerase/epimerase family protein [Chloroflexota bacterium]